MSATTQKWCLEEISEVCRLYSEVGNAGGAHPKVAELATALERTPGSVGMKLANVAAVAVPGTGMPNGSKLDRVAWDAYQGRTATPTAPSPSRQWPGVDVKRPHSKGDIEALALAEVIDAGIARRESAPRREPKPSGAKSYTYVIREAVDGGHIKIGSATNPKSRLRALQTGNPRPLELVHLSAEIGEGEAHRALAAWHVEGEWFSPKAPWESVFEKSRVEDSL